MDLSTFSTDQEKEVEGVWIDDCRIARWNNREMKSLIRKLMRPWSGANSAKSLSDDDAQRVSDQAVASTVLVDWRKLTINGDPVGPYSPARALELFEAFPDFKDWVVRVSRDIENYRTERVEGAKGN